MRIGAIIVAAGRGERAGVGAPKQFRLVLGRPALVWSVEAFAAANASPIVVVVSAGQEEAARAALSAWSEIRFALGGTTRTASVRAGLKALGPNPPDIVFIHDAARPGLVPAMIDRLAGAIEAGADAVAPALPVADALRRVDANRRVVADIDRADLMRVQTPQTFRHDVIRAAYDRAPVDAFWDDDLTIARAAGADTLLISGDPLLMKLTYPEDFDMFERLKSGARTMCVGSGFDAHRFGPGDHVTLCGVRMPHDKGLVGHSDADAGWHALVDAILGALSEGDIGLHFPPSDPQWKGASSEIFLKRALEIARKAGAKIVHVDVTLVCERPKISEYREQMRARTAEVLELDRARVSVKATTTERLGFLGREEGLAAQATVTIERSF